MASDDLIIYPIDWRACGTVKMSVLVHGGLKIDMEGNLVYLKEFMKARSEE